MNPSLSYILTTRNKLPYLRHTLQALIDAKKGDEEILVADAASTDGSAEYLAELLAAGTITYYVSETDAGEAHGYNKLLLRARGELIKVITDDDAIHYPSVARCKEFMLAHPEIDFLNTDGIKRRKKGSNYPMGPLMYRTAYDLWLQRGIPFSSCGLGIMLRRTSLPLLGVFNTSFVRTDAEYTLRVTASAATIAWYPQECYARILNPQSNTTTKSTRYYHDTERLETFYFGTRIQKGRWIHSLKKMVKEVLGIDKARLSAPDAAFTFEEWLDMYNSSQDWLAENAARATGEFLYRR